MAEFQNTIDLLGDDVVVTSVIDRSISEFYDDVLTEIGDFAFYQCKLLQVDLPNLLKVGGQSFSQCQNMVSINLPKCDTVGYPSFNGCSKLQRICLPSLETCEQTSITYCSELLEVDFPKLKSFPYGIFANCAKLRIAKFNSAETFTAYAFGRGSCTNLDTLVLGGDKVVTLAGVNAFNKTPFASGGTGGTVYVPRALIESYQTATNWSTLYAAGTCNFVAREGSEYE